MISALFVETNGIYSKLPNIDSWDVNHDARSYSGPNKVIAHPPCKRWGRYWSGGPNVNIRKHKGDDLGCFDRALWAVRTFGGVLEHPEASSAWTWFGLQKPPKSGGWVKADDFGGMTCCVEQGHYGHKARKATWLYAVGCDMSVPVIFGPSSDKQRMDAGFRSTAARRSATPERRNIQRLTAVERLATPIQFAELLISVVDNRGVTC